LIIAIIIFKFVFGDSSHFAGGDPEGKPLDILGTIYHGGVIVPIIWTQLFAVITLTIERWLALKTAFGKDSLDKFVEQIQGALAKNDMAAAKTICDKQGGSVANVVTATLSKYQEMAANTELDKEQKIQGIQKALGEATALEMPTLQMNLPILAVIVTLGVLTGLLGTVVGMIKSFSALSAGGGTDSSALSAGISEALVNTASGIATSWLSVVFYNFYTNKIDHLTYALDEVGFTIVSTFQETQK
jgi:biopolymer transport protein ExbB